MKKLLTLISLTILLSATTYSAMASGAYSLTEEKVAVSLLIKPIDRKTINELLLNEMQYIQLKNLSKQYQKDVASLTKASLLNVTPKEANLQLINSQYFKELTSVLSEQQISIFLQQNIMAANN